MSKQANLFPLYIQRTAPAERNHFSGLPKQVERANMQGIRAREAGQQSAGYNPGWVWHQERTHEKAAKGLKTVDRAVDTPRPPPELIRTSAAEGQPVPLRGRRP